MDAVFFYDFVFTVSRNVNTFFYVKVLFLFLLTVMVFL